jgi:hypothetical protein
MRDSLDAAPNPESASATLGPDFVVAMLEPDHPRWQAPGARVFCAANREAEQTADRDPAHKEPQRIRWLGQRLSESEWPWLRLEMLGATEHCAHVSQPELPDCGALEVMPPLP